jgi:hypothetical protein
MREGEATHKFGKGKKMNARQIMSYIIYTRGSGGVRCSGTGDDKDEIFAPEMGQCCKFRI